MHYSNDFLLAAKHLFCCVMNIPYVLHSKSHAHILSLRWVSQRMSPSLRLSKLFHTMLIFYDEGLLAPRPTPTLKDHPFSFVHGCLFSIFIAVLHSWRASICTLRMCHAVVMRDPPNVGSRKVRWAGHVE
jgi:hypothetical protein